MLSCRQYKREGSSNSVGAFCPGIFNSMFSVWRDWMLQKLKIKCAKVFWGFVGKRDRQRMSISSSNVFMLIWL